MDHKSPFFEFNELGIYGKSHVAFYTNKDEEEGIVNIDMLWGDRTGVLHIGQRQKFAFEDFNVYMPVNLLNYK